MKVCIKLWGVLIVIFLLGNVYVQGGSVFSSYLEKGNVKKLKELLVAPSSDREALCCVLQRLLYGATLDVADYGMGEEGRVYVESYLQAESNLFALPNRRTNKGRKIHALLLDCLEEFILSGALEPDAIIKRIAARKCSVFYIEDVIALCLKYSQHHLTMSPGIISAYCINVQHSLKQGCKVDYALQTFSYALRLLFSSLPPSFKSEIDAYKGRVFYFIRNTEGLEKEYAEEIIKSIDGYLGGKN